MAFNPNLKIGQIIRNADVVDIFKCGNMGGMRRSLKTNTLVIITDYTKGIYHDKWIGGVLHYTGMGKNGDQDINWSQNATLAKSEYNGVDVHLFEVMDAGEYIYCGRIKLVDKPYAEIQQGENGIPRRVWMFPIRPVPDNDVIKPALYVFKDMEDFRARGKHVDEQHMKSINLRKKANGKFVNILPIMSKIEQKPHVAISSDIIGKHVRHATFGIGKIKNVEESSIVVDFDKVGLKKIGYKFCVENKLLEFV